MVKNRTWQKLIDLAARPACPYRSEIISELNRQLDRELWERIQTQRVSGLYVTSVKTTVEDIPGANTSVEEIRARHRMEAKEHPDENLNRSGSVQSDSDSSHSIIAGLAVGR